MRLDNGYWKLIDIDWRNLPLKTFNVLSSNIYLPGFALGNDSHNEYVFDMHKKNITFSNTDLTTRFLFILMP